jgi:hypothetical protein
VGPRSCRDPAEAVEREGRGLWGKTGQRSLERSACLALLVIARKPGNEGPVLAQLGHAAVVALCPLLGAERKTYTPIELFSF